MRKFAPLLAAALLLAPLAGQAEPVSPDGDVTAMSPLRRAAVSAELFEQALAERDPLLALAAARLRQSVFGEEVTREPERDGPAPEGDAATPVTWEDMLDTALALAPGDPTIEGLADDMRMARAKGVVSGKVYSISQIRAGGEDTYRPLEYEGNAYAEVYVEGRGPADINVKVFDSAGRLVCSDTDISSIAYCGWRPIANDNFSVVVLNSGGEGTSYTLITN